MPRPLQVSGAFRGTGLRPGGSNLSERGVGYLDAVTAMD